LERKRGAFSPVELTRRRGGFLQRRGGEAIEGRKTKELDRGESMGERSSKRGGDVIRLYRGERSPRNI